LQPLHWGGKGRGSLIHSQLRSRIETLSQKNNNSNNGILSAIGLNTFPHSTRTLFNTR
jgi:hypothetical protein